MFLLSATHKFQNEIRNVVEKIISVSLILMSHPKQEEIEMYLFIIIFCWEQ